MITHRKFQREIIQGATVLFQNIDKKVRRKKYNTIPQNRMWMPRHGRQLVSKLDVHRLKKAVIKADTLDE
jgi:hypothetical protein